MHSRALVVPSARRIEVREVDIREPAPGEVLIETLVTGVSPGTELRCLHGLQPGTIYPFIPGYALVGRVVAAGAGVARSLGDLVLASGTRHAEGVHLLWGGHCAHAVIPAAETLSLPPGIAPEAAALAPLLAIAWHGMRLSRPRPLERVAVIGLGPIGAMAALAHAQAGAEVVACDVSPERRATAHALGISVIEPSPSLSEAFRARFPDGADVIVDATGSARVMAEAITLGRQPTWGDEHARGPRYLVQGSYAEGFTVPYDPAFTRELTILVPRATVRSDHEAALGLMARGIAPWERVAGRPRTPDEAAAVFAELESDRRNLTVVFRW